MIENNWCKHFTGVQNKVCDRGVPYDLVRDGQQLACIHPSCTQCDLREYKTDEEFAAYLAQVNAAASKSLAQLYLQSTGKLRECLICNEPITALEQVGRCVYARPCGCRQYQGLVPEAWKE